jgi:hypothetical protein
MRSDKHECNQRRFTVLEQEKGKNEKLYSREIYTQKLYYDFGTSFGKIKCLLASCPNFFSKGWMRLRIK